MNKYINFKLCSSDNIVLFDVLIFKETNNYTILTSVLSNLKNEFLEILKNTYSLNINNTCIDIRHDTLIK